LIKSKFYMGSVFAFFVAIVFSGCAEKTEGKAELGATKPAVQAGVKEDVATTQAEKLMLPQAVLLTGSLMADEQSDVASKRGGIVREVLVDRGTFVKKNDVMVQLDTVDAVNSLDQSQAAATELLVRLGLTAADEKFDPSKQPDVKAAKAVLDLATKNFERDKKLFESKVISPEEFDQTRNTYTTAVQSYDLAVAQANQLYRSFQTALTRVKTSRQLLEDMTVKAPFDGAVVERLVAPGESLSDGARVASMVRTNPLRLVLNVPEQAVGKIEERQQVFFKVDAYPQQRFEGIVKRISPAMDEETRTLKVEAEVPNEEQVLKPGLFATAQVQLELERPGVRVPATAIRRRGDTAEIFVVNEGVSQSKMVVTGEPQKGFVEVVEGLKGGETVVSNASEVEDGVRIQ